MGGTETDERRRSGRSEPSGVNSAWRFSANPAKIPTDSRGNRRRVYRERFGRAVTARGNASHPVWNEESEPIALARVVTLARENLRDNERKKRPLLSGRSLPRENDRRREAPGSRRYRRRREGDPRGSPSRHRSRSERDRSRRVPGARAKREKGEGRRIVSKTFPRFRFPARTRGRPPTPPRTISGRLGTPRHGAMHGRLHGWEGEREREREEERILFLEAALRLVPSPYLSCLPNAPRSSLLRRIQYLPGSLDNSLRRSRSLAVSLFPFLSISIARASRHGGSQARIHVQHARRGEPARSLSLSSPRPSLSPSRARLSSVSSSSPRLRDLDD